MIARKPKGDTRLLQRRWQTWYFVQSVPAAARVKLGKRLVVQSLKTKSLPEAQGRRVAVEHHWSQVFERAARGAALSPSEVEEQARDVYMGLLGRLAHDAQRGRVTAEGVDAFRDAAIEDLTDANWEAAGPEIEAIERRLGVKVEPGDTLYPVLAGAILGAQISGAGDYLRGLQGRAPETTWTVAPTVPRPVVQSGEGFAAVSERYLAEREREALSASGQRHMQTAFRLFADFSGDAPLAAVDRKMASTFIDTVQRLDPHWGQQSGIRGLPLSALLKRFPGQLTNASLNHYSSALMGLFSWARKRGDVIGENPFSEQSRKATDAAWAPYTMKELKTLLSGLDGAMREIVLVALYSGMRQAEILQLRGADVRRENGVWFFNLGKEHQLKTKAAVRRIPIHSALFALKLHKRKGPLWPEWTDAAYFSNRFTVARRRLGLTRPRLSFHSTRGNLVTQLDQAGVAQADIAALVGHARGFTFDHYSGGAGLKRLQKVIELVGY